MTSGHPSGLDTLCQEGYARPDLCPTAGPSGRDAAFLPGCVCAGRKGRGQEPPKEEAPGTAAQPGREGFTFLGSAVRPAVCLDNPKESHLAKLLVSKQFTSLGFKQTPLQASCLVSGRGRPLHLRAPHRALHPPAGGLRPGCCPDLATDNLGGLPVGSSLDEWPQGPGQWLSLRPHWPGLEQSALLLPCWARSGPPQTVREPGCAVPPSLTPSEYGGTLHFSHFLGKAQIKTSKAL